MDYDFQGKVVAVTGAANGIGRAIAERFARGGASVAMLDLEHDTVRRAAEEIAAASGARVRALSLDLTERDAVEAAFATVAAELGPVDVLVNNVGQTAREKASDFADSDPQTWEFVIDVSMMTTLLCSRQVVASMRGRRTGKIVNIASDSAFVGDASIADYAAAKAGVIGFTRSLARELAPFGVNVNAVCPGPTRTRGPARMPPDVLAKVVAQIPLGDLCDPADIANGVAFLASSQARFVTGQSLAINGGRIFA